MVVGAQKEFQRLLSEAHRSKSAAFSFGTRSNLRTQFRQYLLFCAFFKLSPLPTTLDVLCAYAQFLSRSIQVSSIRNYLHGVKVFHLILGFPYDFSSNYVLQLTLQGLQRLKPHVPSRAPPMTPTILFRVAAVVNKSSPLEVVVFSTGLILFFLLARLGSVLPVSQTFSKDTLLLRSSFSPCPSGLLVTFRHTKTIQFGKRLLHLPLLRIPGSPICPVSAFESAAFFHSGKPSAPVFQIPFRGSHIALTRSCFLTVFRQFLSRAGIPNHVSFRGHSFRRGGATWAFQCGVPGELIQIFGDWHSDAYKVYLEFSMQSKLEFASRVTYGL